MLKKTVIPLLLIPMLACSREPANEAKKSPLPPPPLPEYTLRVAFEGLIAFADAQRAGQRVVWALLPDADYNPDQATADDLPPCVADEGLTPARLRENFPPHQPALRFAGAQVTRNGVPFNEPFFLIHGQDVRIAIGRSGLTAVQNDKLSTKEELASAVGGNPDDLSDLDRVSATYLNEDWSTVLQQRFLTARVLVDFGELMEARSLLCTGELIPYGFRLRRDRPCNRRANVELAEEVEVRTERVTQAVSVTLNPSGDTFSVEPTTAGEPVTITVLNVMPEALKHTIDPCDAAMTHLEAYRWFYRLLDSPGDCSRHFFPCIVEPEFGGDKCPEKGFTP